MLTDYGRPHRQRLLHPNRLRAVWQFLTSIEPDMGMPDDHLCGIDPNVDPLWNMKRSDAIHKLGRYWRGRADCSHRYTNSLGMETSPNGR